MRITIDIEPSPKKSITADLAALSPLLLMLWDMVRGGPMPEMPPDIGGCKPDEETPSPMPPPSGAV